MEPWWLTELRDYVERQLDSDGLDEAAKQRLNEIAGKIYTEGKRLALAEIRSDLHGLRRRVDAMFDELDERLYGK